MRKPKFSPDECFAEAKKYDKRAKFFKGSPAAYAFLQKNKLLDDACSHMELSPLYSTVRWTHDAVFVEAAKYKNRAEFKRCNQGAYGYALSNRLIDQACAHMRDGKRFWHVFELMAVAVKYEDWALFQSSERQAYNFANRYKLTGMASAHMSKSCITWTKDMVMKEAAKYATRSMFFAMVSGAYKHADKHGYMDEACQHMVVKKRNHTKEQVNEIAKAYTTRSEFQRGDGGAYVFARLNGFLEEACAHMVPGANGFCGEKPAVLYHLRITTLDGLALYKIGITNRDPVARIAGMGLPDGVSAEVLDAILFNSGRDARIAEKRLHRKYAAHRYNGPPVMKNGNTELFTVSVLEL